MADIHNSHVYWRQILQSIMADPASPDHLPASPDHACVLLDHIHRSPGLEPASSDHVFAFPDDDLVVEIEED
ncbi:hypothetical protein Tco_0451108 [Tanacetum coccineum]